MDGDWFRGLRDIPGVEYEPLVAVDRSKLRRVNDQPELADFGSGLHLMWATRHGSTSQSPASQHAEWGDRGKTTLGGVIKRLCEVLELPGTPSDYHFAIQHVLEELWASRRERPDLFETLERLAWLNARLLRARPDTVMYGGKIFLVHCYRLLGTLYEREGAWREALEVHDLWAQLGADAPKREDVAARVAALDAEGR